MNIKRLISEGLIKLLYFRIEFSTTPVKILKKNIDTKRCR